MELPYPYKSMTYKFANQGERKFGLGRPPIAKG